MKTNHNEVPHFTAEWPRLGNEPSHARTRQGGKPSFPKQELDRLRVGKEPL